MRPLHLCVPGALVGALALAACGSDPAPFPSGLKERDKAANVERPVDGAPGVSLIFTRTRDDGWRKVEVSLGGTRATFHDDPSQVMLDANGQGFGNRTAICGLATPDPTGGAPIGIRCAIADGTTLGPVHEIRNSESSWLFDVCTEGDKVTLLYSVGPKPLDPDAAGGPMCQAWVWTAAAGWASAPTAAAGCLCDLRDGVACTDPCFVGQGVRRGGLCDTSGLRSACDDNNPATDDLCTGVASALCTHQDHLAPMP